MSKAIGIIIGLKNSCVGIWKANKVKIIPNEIGEKTTPSIVSFDGKECLVGQEAKEKITKNYQNTYDINRLIGHRFYAKAKRELSSEQETHIDIDNLSEEEDLDITISRVDFEEHCNELFKRCFDSIKEAMEEASLTKNDIDDIVLVGGSSRIPKIQEMIKNYFNVKELYNNINVDEVIAYGAAYLAAVENGNENPKEKDSVENNNDELEKLFLFDVTRVSLGIETQGGVMSVIINRNTPIPVKKFKTYKTTCDDQEELKISVYEGESKLVSNNIKIGDYIIKIKGRGKAGSIKFKIIFEYDINLQLKITAKEIYENNEENLVVIGEKMKISDDETEWKIKEVKQYEEKDIKRFESIKARNDLEYLCHKKKQIIDDMLKWISDNKNDSKKEFEEQKKKLLDSLK